MQFFEDVSQRRRQGLSGKNREAQSVSLADIVIRILAQDHDSNLIQWSQSEGVEDIVFGWEDGLLVSFSFQEVRQVPKVRLCEFGLEGDVPGRREIDWRKLGSRHDSGA
jgi:hypothetical protein